MHACVSMQEVEFLYRNSAAVESRIEDDIRANLQDFGIRVISTGVAGNDEWNTRANVSNFQMYTCGMHALSDT